VLSKGEKLIERKRLNALPELSPPVTVRLKFRKVGTLQYISHLDLQRTFMRVIVRACIPVWYTKGFNPHAKLVFSTPLSIGTQSVCEYLDIRIDRQMSCEELMERLNRELTDELCIVEAYIPKSDFSEIEYASYDFEICTAGASQELAREIEKTLTTSPVNLVKKTKSGEKEIDIVPLINEIKATFDGEKGTIKLSAVLSASSTSFLNPEMLITALKQKNGILAGNLSDEWYTIMRTAVLKQDMTRFR
jgi:radical SAM-linked protein